MLKKLKSLFFVSRVKNNPEEEKEPKIDSVPVQVYTKSKEKPVQTSSPVQSSKQKKKFQQLLLSALEENNLEGYDYIEFRKTIRSLEAITPSEMDRFKSAITMVDSVGSSKKGILDSADYYLKVLQNEKKSFDSALERQKSKTIEVKKQEIRHTKKLIADKEKQILKIQKEIETHSSSLNQMSEQISSADKNIRAMGSGFDDAFAVITSEIKRDISIIQSI